MKRYYFISGLPRSGSTLLSAILRQNPEFYADIASKVPTIVDSAIEIISNSNQDAIINEVQRKNIIHGIFDGYYKNVNQPIVFDSGREWTSRTFLLKELFPHTKIICCVRDIISILNSFETIFSKNALYKNKLLRYNNDVYSRCHELMNEENGIVNVPFLYLREGYAANPEMIMLVEYENLCKEPEKTMRGVYEFLEKPYYSHDFENVEYSNENFDKACNLKDLHTVKRKVEYNPPRNVLPPEIVQKYKKMNMEFWRKEYKPNVDIIEKLDKKFIEYK
jgi:sulfotransferase